MEPIQNAFSALMKNKQFQDTFQKMRQEVRSHPKIISFLAEHKNEITDQMIDSSLVKLYEYIGQSVNCEDCPSFNECKNMVHGYHPHLIIQGKRIDVQYDRCPNGVKHDKRKKHESLIKCMYLPKDVLQASMSNLSLEDPGRFEAISAARQFIMNYEKGKMAQGLYLHGPFGVGKTYILGAIANELAEEEITSMLVYLPEFLRELKSSISDGTLEEKIEAVKKVEVLMLDDIGAEQMSSWARDEILGTILQYRMLEKLPTFFTSNADLNQLEHHLTYSQRGEEERVKAARIVDRVKFLAKPVKISGSNLRHS
ncbi:MULTISPECIES: primosomal protein DnaI [Bacillaceae]|jgi:primosomal protein DnaI|uniref:Primosomal protein DnaI n=1 Tax=Gottfriedia luciferensis TaxID=178774 RepID=A0ABX2ZMV9_9BACI|nr:MULTISPECIES: primosomal protein DnaI [Bacillaceae]ODG90712.1 primosomal protein DnaI [Gottfriedia luciferensis]PGZ85505.1 primosomal protein DnaI [Bacillus sp. AFS029533]SFD26855.1 primosomal protein DnaI [Bacillus sp. UNCCL81]